MHKKHLIPRDISWLSFNARVLQEANDPTVPLKERIRFLGIHSNNMDEFFRVRVATLRRMMELGGKKANMHLEENPQDIIDQIQATVLQQQNEFNRIWETILTELAQHRVFLVDEKQLNREQAEFVRNYFDQEVRTEIIPLMIETLPVLPYLRDKSIYLGVVMRKKDSGYDQKYALLEVPTRATGRFVLLPSKEGEHRIMLLEDVVRFNLPNIFSYFGYDHFDAHIFKVTKDAEIDIDNDITTSFVQKIEKGLKNRRKGKAVRFIYDKEMDAGLLEYLIRRLNLSRKDNIIPGGRIHNFRHFMDFPDVLPKSKRLRRPFPHPDLRGAQRVTDVIQEKDVLLHFPHHTFDHIIDLLRESAIDPDVTSIRITAYRLASNSKVINALINAARNGKEVVVMLELRARFDEEANLDWKETLELEGVRVLIGLENMKVHAKLCLIRKKKGKRTVQYGFVSTGNLNEKTSLIYADECLLTAEKAVTNDIARIFSFLEEPRADFQQLRACKTLVVSPVAMRRKLTDLIDREIRHVKTGKEGFILLKLNSLSDETLISRLQEAAASGVQVNLIIRSILCGRFAGKKIRKHCYSISIVDEYLEHARIMIFGGAGKEKCYVTSADWMVRNLDHRVEAAVPLKNKELVAEMKAILQIQLSDNVKARILDDHQSNEYASAGRKKKVRSQVETYNYLLAKAGGNK